jgi:tRNA(fMet)-specific endonuclease VapC
MTMQQVKRILDADNLSAIMRDNPSAVQRAQAYLREAGKLTFSIVTIYEISRGLKAKGAIRQLNDFCDLCAASEILDLTRTDVERAADIYADLKQRGELIGDADILIAATAIENEAVLVSGNKRHFGRIPSLRTENWLE